MEVLLCGFYSQSRFQKGMSGSGRRWESWWAPGIGTDCRWQVFSLFFSEQNVWLCLRSPLRDVWLDGMFLGLCSTALGPSASLTPRGQTVQPQGGGLCYPSYLLCKRSAVAHWHQEFVRFGVDLNSLHGICPWPSLSLWTKPETSEDGGQISLWADSAFS